MRRTQMLLKTKQNRKEENFLADVLITIDKLFIIVLFKKSLPTEN